MRKEKKRKREMVTGPIGKSRKGTGDGWKITSVLIILYVLFNKVCVYCTYMEKSERRAAATP